MAKSIMSIALGISKSIKAAGSVSWYYFKVEAAPPMTIALLNGSLGKSIEKTAGNVIDGVIKGLSDKIRTIEFEAAQAIKAKEAEAKRKEEAKKAEAVAAAKKAAEVAKSAAASKAAEAKAAEAKKEAESKAKKPEAKKPEAPKKGGGAKKK